MKKIKILTPILGVATTVGAIAPLSSCGCTQAKFIEGAETNIAITGNEVYNYYCFTLNNPLEDGQTITTDLVDTDYFTYGSPVIENKLVSVPVVWNQLPTTKSKVEAKDIKFTCKNKDESVAWEQTIMSCSATYSPSIVLNSETKVTTTEKDDKTLIYQFEFELGEELDEILTLKPWFTNIESVTSTGSWTINQDEATFEITGKKAVLTVPAKKETAIAEGDGVKFDLQIECLVEGTSWTYWQSNVFKEMSITYMNEEVGIDVRCFVLRDDETETPATGQSLIGIDTSSEYWTGEENTLVIPAKSDDLWIRYIGDKDTNQHIELPDQITKIKIDGIGVQEIRKNAFQGNTNIKYIDFEAIPDTVKSLDSVLVFDDNAFADWADEGQIIWNKDLSQYKRHIVKEKLYKAGLQNSNWFGYTEVDNLSALKEAAYTGGNIRLTNDIKIYPDENFTGQINFYTSSILDLNGHSIYLPAEVSEGVPNKPIFNSQKKEFAVIGVWDCELVVTDSSENHNGSIKAFDNSSIHNEGSKPSKEGITDNNQWEWETNRGEGKPNRYRTRENRVFYVRSDIPTRAKGTLEILAGNFYGNCTTIMNWNTTVYVEDEYSNYPERKEDYVGEYAPTFHLYSKNCGLDTYTKYSNPTAELINCEDSTSKTGQAKFELWGGKLMAYANTDEARKIVYYDPETSTADRLPDTKEGDPQYGHWNYQYAFNDEGYFVKGDKISEYAERNDGTNYWTLLIPQEYIK